MKLFRNTAYLWVAKQTSLLDLLSRTKPESVLPDFSGFLFGERL